MDNNDVLRSLRYTFDYSDKQMIQLFELGGLATTRAQVSDWLKREDNEEFVGIYDQDLARYLNGMILLNRGKKEGEEPKAEKKINNNIVFRKLKIALNLKDEDILDILKSVGMSISKHELSAFFRHPGKTQFKACKDQVLRYFLQGLKQKYRPLDPDEDEQE